jgi:dehydrogenase/reductase SDR family protein 12
LIAETKELASRLAGRNRIDVLINNAGAMFSERGLTSEGLEQTFALNLLSGFVLTESLVPKLIESAPARIINMSSGGMYSRGLDMADLQNSVDYKPADAYAHTKRAQVILTELWAKQLQRDGVGVHAVHPGWTDTDGVRHSLPTFAKMSKPFLRSPAEGADTMVWLAASDPESLNTGLFWHDRAPRPTHYMKGTKADCEDRASLRSELTQVAANL